MIISRLLYFILRCAEFIASVVVLGLTAYFLDEYRHQPGAPRPRLIYSVIWSALSTLLSLFWLLPFTFNFLHYPADFVMSAGMFAVFGLLVNWIDQIGCGSAFHWAGLADGSQCGRWKAAEAFSFMAAIFFFVSFLLGIYVYHKLRRNATVATTTTTTGRRRFGRSRV